MSSTEFRQKADRISKDLFELLKQRDRQLVLAESCTGELIGAVLTQYPGISNWLCGSAVVYQDNTKTEWLHVDPSLIQEFTSVSRQVTEKMAIAALVKTSGAEFALAVTGHLESGACDSGTQAFVAFAARREQQLTCILSEHHPLLAGSRVDRQWEATCHALTDAVNILRNPDLN